MEIARRAGADVVALPFEGFVKTRLAALALVRTPWTFMLDADERLDAALRAAIAAIDPDTPANGFTISRRTWFCGKPIAGCGWGDERMLRLFRTGRAALAARPASGGSAELHERWSVPGRAPLLAGRLEHDSYAGVADYFTRFDRYTWIESRGLPKSARRLALSVVQAPLRAVWLFTVRGGWRDGWRGAFIALFSALYPVAANLKAFAR